MQEVKINTSCFNGPDAVNQRMNHNHSNTKLALFFFRGFDVSVHLPGLTAIHSRGLDSGRA